MAKLAIKGHSTRGNEVINILEMLGGYNLHSYSGDEVGMCYYIDNDEYYGKVISLIKIPTDSIVFTLEEFLVKYPYKFGDKVNYVKYNDGYPSIYIIHRIRWTGRTVEYLLDSNGFTALAKDLQPYKEEEMKKEISGAIVDRFICLEGYDFYDDKGNIIDTKEITMKKQSKYPKTYEDCCDVLKEKAYKTGFEYKSNIIFKFQQLLICRDAYWKMSGDWKPNFTNKEEKFVITYYYGKIYTTVATNYNRVLVFPTEEMRDAFYENFKELIEECKELL